MTTQETAVEKKDVKALTLRSEIEGEAFKAALQQALPKLLTPERFVRVAITAITKTPKLKDCDRGSFFSAMLTLAQLGLEPDGRRAHLIPYANNKKGIMECQLIIDYKGLAELAYRSGMVSVLHADVVCEHDEFEYDRGRLLKHKPEWKKPRGEIYAAYALCRFKDGSEKCEVMSRDEIEAIRKRSRAGNAGPWVSDWQEMAKKTAFRRLSKWLPLSAEVRDAIDKDDDVIDIASAPVARPEPLTPFALTEGDETNAEAKA